MGSSEFLWAFALLVVSVAVFFRPWLGLLLLILAGALGRLAAFPLFDLDLVEIAAALTAWSGAIFLAFTRKRIELSPLDMPVALLMLATLFSVVNAPDPEMAFTGMKFLGLLVVYFITVQLLNTASRVRATLAALTVVAGVLAALCIALYFIDIPTISLGGAQAQLFYGGGGGVRMAGPVEQPNIWAQITGIAVPVGLALAISTKGWWRWLLAGMTAINFASTLMTQSRSAAFGVIAGIGCVLFFLRQRLAPPLKAVLLLGMVASSLVVMEGLANLERFSQNPVELELRAERRRSRAQVFVASVKVFLQHPMGVGFGADARMVGGELGRAGMSPHNAILRWAIEAGFIGLIAGIWLMVSQVRNLWRMARDQMGSEWGQLAAGVLGAIVTTWIHNMFHAFQHLAFVWIFFSVASAMVLLRPNFASAPPPAAARLRFPYARTVLPT